MSMTQTDAERITALQATIYSSRNPMRRWLHVTRRSTVIDAIRRAPAQHYARAIEVGPGSGVYLPTLCERFERVTALDVEPAHLEAIAPMQLDLPNLELIQADIVSHSWEERFDLLLASEVLEHVAEPDAFVGGLARSLKPGGILVLSTPQPWSTMEAAGRIGLSPPIIHLTRMIYREPVEPTGHISLTSMRDLKAMLDKWGLDIIEEKRFGLYLPVIGEFGGKIAVRVGQTLEQFINDTFGRSLLWTQLYIARKRLD